jgi:hypothetical protein
MSEKKPVQRESIRDLSKLLKDVPPGLWVALSNDETRVLGSGSTMKEASYQAQQKGEKNPVLIKMPLEGEGSVAGVI